MPQKRKAEDAKPRRRTKRLKMSKTKSATVVRVFEDIIEEQNRTFLQQPERALELEEQLDKEKALGDKYKDDVSFMQQYQESQMKQKDLYRQLSDILLRKDQILYTNRLCNLLLFFFDKSVDLPNRLLKVAVMKQLQAWLYDCTRHLEGKNQQFIVQITPTLNKILLELTKHVMHNRQYLFPHSPDSRAESVRVFALPIPILNKTLEEVYMWWFAPEHTLPTIVQKDICEFCHSALLLQRKESMQTCKCSAHTYTFFNMTHHNMDYSKANTTQAHDYERRKFFERWLSQFKEGSKKIPDNILMMVKRELLNMQITSKLDVKMTTVKTILQNLNLQSYTTNAAKIANILNDVEIAEFTDEQFAEIMERTRAVEEVYLYYKRNPHPGLIRVNFPNFSYMVRQICMINKWQTLKRRFRLAKLENSREVQEKEWKIYIPCLKKMDPKHRWKFIPTK